VLFIQSCAAVLPPRNGVLLLILQATIMNQLNLPFCGHKSLQVSISYDLNDKLGI